MTVSRPHWEGLRQQVQLRGRTPHDAPSRSSGERRNGSRRGRRRTRGESAAQRQAWLQFLHAAVARYGPGGEFWRENRDLPRLPIRQWEIWNEENIVTFSHEPDPERFARLIRDLRPRLLHRADPGSKVILGGLFGRPLQTPPNVQLGRLPHWPLPGAAT